MGFYDPDKPATGGGYCEPVIGTKPCCVCGKEISNNAPRTCGWTCSEIADVRDLIAAGKIAPEGIVAIESGEPLAGTFARREKQYLDAPAFVAVNADDAKETYACLPADLPAARKALKAFRKVWEDINKKSSKRGCW